MFAQKKPAKNKNLHLFCSLLIVLALQLAFSHPQAAPTISVSYELLTGGLPLDANDTPGNDSSTGNAIVRTNDSLLVSFQLGISSEDETNVVLTASASPGVEFSLPVYCLTSGVTPPSSIISTATGQTITCNTGNHTSGTAASFALPGRVMPDLANASTVEIYSASVSGDGAGKQNFPGATITVSAAPKFDIQKIRGAKIYGAAPGPNGEPGLVQLFPLLITVSNDGLGAENSLADIVISDDLSGVSSSALLFQGWNGALNSACFGNAAETGYEINNIPQGYTQTTDGGPGGAGAGSQQQSVFNSGNFNCPSVSPGGTATITIAGADLSGVNYPTNSFNGSALPVNERYLVSGILAVWFPTQDVVDNAGELPISNTYLPQSFTSISGQNNIEPNTTNNTKSYVLRETTPGAGRYFFIGKNNGGGNLEGQTVKRSGDGSLVAGQAFNSTQRQSNAQAFTETDYNNLHLCTSFDNSAQILRKRSGTYALVTLTGTPRTTQPAFTVQYGTGAFGGNAACGDTDSPDGWVSDPTTLPGGLTSATKVRAVGNLIAPADSADPTRAELRVYYTALANPVGMIIPQWGTYQSDDFNNGDWVLSDYDANTALGQWGDRATLTTVVVRIDKDTQPGNTQSVIAGKPLTFELEWSATLFGTPPNPSAAVTITDTLPKEYAYTAGSASVAPVSISNNADGTTTLVWFFPAAAINANQTAITYDVLVKNTTPDATTVANTVVISSPDDPTAESARTDTHGMNVLNSAILSVFKEALPSLTGRDDPITFRLSYANTGSSTLSNLQIIDVLPDNRWVRNPATNFNGTLDFVSLNGGNNETFEYSKTPLSSLKQDPLHASNQSGGSTIWCSSFSGGTCPASAAEVTAYRVTVPQTLLPTDGVQEITLVLQPTGNAPNDIYSNNFSAKADELAISVTSSTATARVIAQYDYGDAPAVFGDAQHTFLEEYRLGPLIDAESIALSGSNADGDDNSGSNDDDGINISTLTQGENTTLTALVTGTGGYLQGWVDFDGSNSFEAGEQIASNLTDGDNDGSISINFTVPITAINTAPTYARFRWSTDNGLNSSAPAGNGEAEDYQISIATGAAKIAGTVYLDNDSSNTQNGSEAGVAAITITLFDDNDTPTDISDDTVTATTSTAPDGSYQFNGLSVGTFRVSVDTNDTDLPIGTLIGTANPVYNVTTSLGTTSAADFGFDLFTCVPGGGMNDPAVVPYLSTEVDGTGIGARNATDILDNDWRVAAGLPLSGAVIPWFGYTPMSLSNNEPILFNTRGVDVGVALVNIQSNAPCSGNIHTTGGPNLSTSNTMQQNSPRPASLYTSGAQPAFWNESSGHNSSPNAVRFSFASPVKAFGAWFGDLETRTDGFGSPAYLRLLDGSGNRIGADIAIEPQTISNGITTAPVDQNQCGSTASDTGCGNSTTRWIGFIDNVASPRIRQAIVIVGDDDFADLGGSESLSFIGMDINTGYQLAGRVYQDNNVDGIDSTEAGIGAVTMVLHDTSNNSCRSTQTNADGHYAFNDVQIAGPDNYVVYEAAQAIGSNSTSCPPSASDPTGLVSSTVNMRIVTISNADVTGIDFGDVPEPHFTQDNQQTILPNSSVIHPHIFTAYSTGSVNFTLNSSSDPGNLYWGETLYQDTNCDAQLDGSDLLLSGGLALNAGEKICLLVKVIAPANASNGATHTLQIQSDFSYGNGSSSLANHQQVHTDITTVIAGSGPNLTPTSGEGKLSLLKSVWNVSRNINGSVALPGETLRYTITYENIGQGPLNEMVLSDSVPAFTELVPGSLRCNDRPAGLAACTLSSDTTGNLEWRWTALDKLQPGTSGSVSFDVILE